MPEVKPFHYELPDYVEPTNYNADDFIADAIKVGYDSRHSLTSWNQIRIKQPWLNQLRPIDALGNISAVVVETTSAGYPFRLPSAVPHIDNDGFGSKIAILRTSTSPFFASCIVQVNMDEYRDNHRLTDDNPALAFASFVGRTDRNWLMDASEGKPLTHPILKDIIVAIEDLKIERGRDNVISLGETAKTLHWSADRVVGDPDTSVIARAIYTPL